MKFFEVNLKSYLRSSLYPALLGRAKRAPIEHDFICFFLSDMIVVYVGLLCRALAARSSSTLLLFLTSSHPHGHISLLLLEAGCALKRSHTLAIRVLAFALRVNKGYIWLHHHTFLTSESPIATSAPKG